MVQYHLTGLKVTTKCYYIKSDTYLFHLTLLFPTHIYKMTNLAVEIWHSDFNRTTKFLKMDKSMGNEDQD